MLFCLYNIPAGSEFIWNLYLRNELKMMKCLCLLIFLWFSVLMTWYYYTSMYNPKWKSNRAACKYSFLVSFISCWVFSIARIATEFLWKIVLTCNIFHKSRTPHLLVHLVGHQIHNDVINNSESNYSVFSLIFEFIYINFAFDSAIGLVSLKCWSLRAPLSNY